MSTVLTVMAKAPRPGRAKTRLAASLGGALAARLARALLRDTWSSASRLPGVAARISTPDPSALGRILGVRCHLQGDGDLGDRIERALLEGLREADRALVIGSDAPDVPPAAIRAVVDALSTMDVVLGPVPDGGFWILGVRRWVPGILAGVRWSVEDTLEQVEDRLDAAGLTRARGPAWQDVDDAAGLDALADRLARGEGKAPRTWRVLNRIGR